MTLLSYENNTQTTYFWTVLLNDKCLYDLGPCYLQPKTFLSDTENEA